MAFKYYIQFSVEPTYINITFTDFVATVRINSSAGTTTENLTDVFAKLNPDSTTSYTNRKKIEIRTSGGAQCYIEIVKWDDDAQDAVLRFRAPSLSHTVNTDFVLWYDPDESDNTTYVGDVGEAAAIAVWTPVYGGGNVWGLDQDPSESPDSILDSLGTDNMSPTGGMTSGDQVAGRIGDGLDFDGVDDAIVTDNNWNKLGSSEWNISFWMKIPIGASPDYGDIIEITDAGETSPSVWIWWTAAATRKLIFYAEDSLANTVQVEFQKGSGWADGKWYLVMYFRTGDTFKLYVGQEGGSWGYKTEQTNALGDIGQSDAYFSSGRSALWEFAGVLDDIRVCVGDPLSGDWGKAMFYDGFDAIIEFSTPAETGIARDDQDFVVLGKTADEQNFVIQGTENLVDQQKFVIFSAETLNDDQNIVTIGKTADEQNIVILGKSVDQQNFIVLGEEPYGRRLGLRDTLDLRDTSVYSEPRNISTLPLVFGDFSNSRIPCTALDVDGYLYHISDYAIHSIVEVQVDGEPMDYGFTAYTKYLDSTDTAISALVFDNPQYDANISVSCRGIIKQTGELISNPSDFVRFILETVQGYDSRVIDEVGLNKFYSDSLNENIIIAIYVQDVVEIKTVFDELSKNLWSRWKIRDGSQNIAYRWL